MTNEPQGIVGKRKEYPPKKCEICGNMFQPSKFTWNYAKRCENCRKPKHEIDSSAKTKHVPCQECGDLVVVGIFAANVQFCDVCREKKGITKKGIKIEEKKQVEVEPVTKRLEKCTNNIVVTGNKLLDVHTNGNHEESVRRFFTALTQIDVETSVFIGEEDRKNRIKEYIYLYLIPRGYNVGKNMLHKEYDKIGRIAVCFFRDKITHISYKFKIRDGDDTKFIKNMSEYDKLPQEMKDDLDMVVLVTDIYEKEFDLSREFIDMIHDQQKSLYSGKELW